MRVVLVVIAVCGALGGCGGSVADNEEPAPGESGAAGQGPAAPTSQPFEEESGSYPQVPPGSGAFFWRGGMGNWFVTTAMGGQRDAEPETIDGLRVWKGSSSPGDTDLWAQLSHPSGAAIDLSAYSGIAFEARAVAGRLPLVVVFNANGDVEAAAAATDAQRFDVSEGWQSHELAFANAGAPTGLIASVDFIASPLEPVELQIRKLALRCKMACP